MYVFVCVCMYLLTYCAVVVVASWRPVLETVGQKPEVLGEIGHRVEGQRVLVL